MRGGLLEQLKHEARQFVELLAILLQAVRSWANKNPRLVVGLTALSVLLLVAIIIALLTPDERMVTMDDSEKQWCYNLDTGELFAASIAEHDRAGGGGDPNMWEPLIANAYVMSYAYEPNESQRFIGFLEIPDPNAGDEPAPGKGGAGKWGRGKLIRRVEDLEWVPADGKAGQKLLQSIFRPNEMGQMPRYCPPK